MIIPTPHGSRSPYLRSETGNCFLFPFSSTLTKRILPRRCSVHWTLTLAHRATGWLSDRFHQTFREMLPHSAAREGLFCPTYCLMPDHMHLIFMGLRLDTNQLNAMAFLRTYIGPELAPAEFQNQAYDRVLREMDRRENAFAETCQICAVKPCPSRPGCKS
jgi:hypothetical protein